MFVYQRVPQIVFFIGKMMIYHWIRGTIFSERPIYGVRYKQ